MVLSQSEPADKGEHLHKGTCSLHKFEIAISLS